MFASKSVKQWRRNLCFFMAIYCGCYVTRAYRLNVPYSCTQKLRNSQCMHLRMSAKIAIIGEGSDNGVAALVAEKYGSTAIDVAEALRQKKGRKTDKVKAAKARELTDASLNNDWILVGFPNTITEAELFCSNGISFDKIIYVNNKHGNLEKKMEIEQSATSLRQKFSDKFIAIDFDTPEIMASAIVELIREGPKPLINIDQSPIDNSKDTTELLPFAEFGDVEVSKPAPSVPWYAAVAKPTKKGRKKAISVVNGVETEEVPSVIVQRLASSNFIKEDATAIRSRFGDFRISSSTATCLSKAGIKKPTPIQKASMIRISKRESVLLHAETGSGKTLAFLIPLMERIASKKNISIQVIVVVPTRELAVQIAREAVLLGGGLTSGVELLIDSQAAKMASDIKAPIVIGTSKVLAQMVKKTKPWLRKEIFKNLTCLVCDEIDRLVDTLSKYATKTELEQRARHPRPVTYLLQTLKSIQPSLQIVACSATVGRPLRRELSKALGIPEFKDGPAVVRATSGGPEIELAHNRAVPIPPTIQHLYLPLWQEEFEDKVKALIVALEECSPLHPLIFIPSKESVNLVVMRLIAAGFAGAKPLHEAIGFGDAESENTSGFSHATQALAAHDNLANLYQSPSERGPVLVASADSARGLHFENVDYVFILGRARGPDEYVHLSGRTGRQGKMGTVLSVVTFKELKAMKGWEAQLNIKMSEFGDSVDSDDIIENETL